MINVIKIKSKYGAIKKVMKWGAMNRIVPQASCEIIINAYSQSYFKKINSNVKIASVRAGNVIGGGDWSENRIIPDCVRSWEKKFSNPE